MKTSSDNCSDADLIAAANKGEKDAFEALYYRYRDWVYSLAFRFSGNKEDACDVLQETFLYLFNKFPGFELRSQMKTFLYPVAKHLALDCAKKNKRTESIDNDIKEMPAEKSRDHKAERENLTEYVKRLPEAQREVILLRFADGLNLNEIAQVLEIPSGTVKSRLHTAINACRNNLPTS